MVTLKLCLAGPEKETASHAHVVEFSCWWISQHKGPKTRTKDMLVLMWVEPGEQATPQDKKEQEGTVLWGLDFTGKATGSTVCLAGRCLDGHREIPSILESQRVEWPQDVGRGTVRGVGLGASTSPRASNERSSAESKVRSNAEKVGTCGLEE